MKNTRFVTGFIFFILLGIVIGSCTKTVVPDQPIFPTGNNWQCQIDGVSYSGTIDTSVSRVSAAGNDTTVFFTGTASDKKMSILFSVVINRQAAPTGVLSSNFSISFLYIDTTAAYYVTSPYSSSSAITVKINSFAANALNGTFNGTINSPDGASHIITNGIANCTIGQGDNEPKFFSFKDNTDALAGYVDYARVASNSLIINGSSLTGNGQKFKLIIHTGGTIKTGIFKSANGDVGLQVYQSGQFTDYVNDTLGDLTVNIISVQGNIIAGTFSGSSVSLLTNDTKTITDGRFNCKVINYQPQIDSVNKWSFSEDEPMFNYNIYGGNIVSASFSQDGPKHYFILNGESDNGSAAFKLQLSDYSEITTGLYQTGYIYTTHIDSMYFNSPAKISGNTSTALYMYGDYIGYCNIDTLDEHHITGTLFGKIEISLDANGFTSADMKIGSFRASF